MRQIIVEGGENGNTLTVITFFKWGAVILGVIVLVALILGMIQQYREEKLLSTAQGQRIISEKSLLH